MNYPRGLRQMCSSLELNGSLLGEKMHEPWAARPPAMPLLTCILPCAEWKGVASTSRAGPTHARVFCTPCGLSETAGRSISEDRRCGNAPNPSVSRPRLRGQFPKVLSKRADLERIGVTTTPRFRRFTSMFEPSAKNSSILHPNYHTYHFSNERCITNFHSFPGIFRSGSGTSHGGFGLIEP